MSGLFHRVAVLLATLAWTSPHLQAQYRNYSLTCLAPILESIDPDAPQTLQEAFLGGPFRFAEPLEGIGAQGIDFPISTESSEAQAMFEQGIALLHLLWYGEAERAFRTVVELDPHCPMGYWGLAQANELRPGRARLFARAARDQCDGNRPKLEQRWTELLAEFYAESDAPPPLRSRIRIRDLESLVMDFPNHREATAFLIRRLTLDRYRMGLSVTSQLGVDALIRDFTASAPYHPSRHYRIFLWLADRPEMSLPDAAAGPLLAPGAPETWRYAAEAFAASGQPAAAVRYHEIAVRTDHRDLSRRRLMPDSSQNLRSNQAALVHGLIEAGRIEEALRWARRTIALPTEPGAGGWESEQLYADALMGSRQWERLLRELESQPHLTIGEQPDRVAARLLWRGLCQLALDRRDEAVQTLEELTVWERNHPIPGATDAMGQAIGEARKTLEVAYRHLTGESPTADLAAWRSLPLSPLVSTALCEMAGRDEEAYRLAVSFSESRPGAWLPEAFRCHLALRTGRDREGLFVFDRQFRSHASLADPALTILEELRPLAERLQLPVDWTLPAPRLEEPGFFREPADAGPGRWIPLAAPNFDLADRFGERLTLDDFSGRPLLLNFFLGARCPFCLEQFEVFRPHWPAFAEAGIAVAAVSIDSAETMNRVFRDSPDLENLLRHCFPHPVLADPDLAAFRAFGVYDDFENGPMHGIFLLDSRGRILWRWASHATFENPIPLLWETKRLIALHDQD